jgi:hypothetical protein
MQELEFCYLLLWQKDCITVLSAVALRSPSDIKLLQGLQRPSVLLGFRLSPFIHTHGIIISM